MISEQSNEESDSKDSYKPNSNIEVVFPVLLAVCFDFFEKNILVVVEEVVIVA